MAWSSTHNTAVFVPLTPEEQAQKLDFTVMLLHRLDPLYSGESMNLARVLTLHLQKSESGETLAIADELLLEKVISIRKRDYAHCLLKQTADEPHAFVIRSFMQLCNMYRSNKYSNLEFDQYIREDTPVSHRVYKFEPHWQKQEQQHPRNMGGCWRRGSESSISSTSSSVFPTCSSIASTATSASSTSSFAVDDFASTQRPYTAPPRLEGAGVYVPPARRGSREDIMQKKSWR